MRIIKSSLFFLLICLMSFSAMAAGKSEGCTTIQSGSLTTSAGDVITPGFDAWGYNYQAMQFNGGYCDAYRNAGWCQMYAQDELVMKWNSAWMSNKDCDGDGKLDRHFGFPSYIGSGAWLTNHTKGTYEDDDGKVQHWTYFTKIVAAPADATKVGGQWVGADGTVIGPVIWNEFAILLEIYNDSGTGEHGVLYKSPSRPGFGSY